eukprot:gene13226-15537_t
MKYKANYQPSELLCSASYQFVDIVKAIGKLEEGNKTYAPFAVDVAPAPYSTRQPTLVESLRMKHGNNWYDLSMIKREHQEAFRDTLLGSVGIEP